MSLIVLWLSYVYIVGLCSSFAVTSVITEIDFNNYTVDSSEESYAMRFFELSQDLFLKQIVQENTRFMTGQKPSRLDYVFLRDDSIIDELQYLPPTGSSDHAGLLWGLRSDQSHQLQVETVSSCLLYTSDAADE